MAKKQNKQSTRQSNGNRKTANSTNSRQRTGGAADFTQKKNTATAHQQSAKPKRVNKDAAAEAVTPGNLLWRLGLILCVGIVVFSLLFASINGGSKYVGVTYETEKENTTPTPPVSGIDPNVNITGSDATPIPPTPTPDVTETPVPEGGESTGGTFINGQLVTP